MQKFSRIDVLFNNASYQGPEVEDFREISRDRLEAICLLLPSGINDKHKLTSFS